VMPAMRLARMQMIRIDLRIDGSAIISGARTVPAFFPSPPVVREGKEVTPRA
jgi:hypothetical protein